MKCENLDQPFDFPRKRGSQVYKIAGKSNSTADQTIAKNHMLEYPELQSPDWKPFNARHEGAIYKFWILYKLTNFFQDFFLTFVVVEILTSTEPF